MSKMVSEADQQYEAGHGSEMVEVDEGHAARHVTVPGAHKEQPEQRRVR